MHTFAIQKKPIKITVMEQNYRITIFTTEGVIQRKFYDKKTAISEILAYRDKFEEFKVGVLCKKNEEKWNIILSVKK